MHVRGTQAIVRAGRRSQGERRTPSDVRRTSLAAERDPPPPSPSMYLFTMILIYIQILIHIRIHARFHSRF